MNIHNIRFIGLDTHKEFIEVAYIEDQRGAQPIHHTGQPTTKLAITKLAVSLMLNAPMRPCILSMKQGLAVTGFIVFSPV